MAFKTNNTIWSNLEVKFRNMKDRTPKTAYTEYHRKLTRFSGTENSQIAQHT